MDTTKIELEYVELKQLVNNILNNQKNNKVEHYLNYYINHIKALHVAKVPYSEIAIFLNNKLNLKGKKILTGKKLSQIMFKLKRNLDENEVNNILNNIKKDIEMDIKSEVEKEIEKDEKWENI